MTSCSQLEDIEALVFGEIESSRAPALRAHAEACAECRAELAMLSAERALFSHRAQAIGPAPPPPVLGDALPDAPRRRGARFATEVVRILRRGHFTAACAAALFLVAAFSRPGGTSLVTASASQVPLAEGDGASSGVLASMQTEESLACSVSSAPSVVQDELAASFASRVSQAPVDAVLACGGARDGSRSAAACIPSVTCSSLRQ